MRILAISFRSEERLASFFLRFRRELEMEKKKTHMSFQSRLFFFLGLDKRGELWHFVFF